MTHDPADIVVFDDLVALALAELAAGEPPAAGVRLRLMAALDRVEAAAPEGFAFCMASNEDWQPHPVPGIRMKVLAANRRYVTRLLDFLHADGGSDHGELWTEEGCRVLLVVPPEDDLPGAAEAR